MLYKQCVWATVFRRDQVDDRSPSKTLWLGDPKDTQRIYLCQPVLSSVDDSSRMTCIVHVPICALKIETYCMFFVYFSIPAV